MKGKLHSQEQNRMQQYQQALHTLPLTYMDREIAPESVFLQDNVASGQLRLPSLDASI